MTPTQNNKHHAASYGKPGDEMPPRKGLILSACTVLLMLLLLKKTSLGHLLTSLFEARPDPLQEARAEREQEEEAYQNAIRWNQVAGCF